MRVVGKGSDDRLHIDLERMVHERSTADDSHDVKRRLDWRYKPDRMTRPAICDYSEDFNNGMR